MLLIGNIIMTHERGCRGGRRIDAKTLSVITVYHSDHIFASSIFVHMHFLLTLPIFGFLHSCNGILIRYPEP